MQKEIQKQMTVMVAVPVAKEGKRMEGTRALLWMHCITLLRDIELQSD